MAWKRTPKPCQSRDSLILQELGLAVEQLWLNSPHPHSFPQKALTEGGRAVSAQPAALPGAHQHLPMLFLFVISLGCKHSAHCQLR